jgi:hypothetical protein
MTDMLIGYDPATELAVEKFSISAEPLASATMISDLDIWLAATMLIRQHGDAAEVVVALRVDQMTEREDQEGHAV